MGLRFLVAAASLVAASLGADITWFDLGDETRVCKDSKACAQAGNSWCTLAKAKRRCAVDTACKGVYDISKNLSRWRLCTSKKIKAAGERGHGVKLIARAAPAATTASSTTTASAPAASTTATTTTAVSADCVMSSWGAWGACSVSCNSGAGGLGGTHFRTRSVLAPAAGLGMPCPFAVQAKACNTHCCDGFARAADPKQKDLLVQAATHLRDGSMVQSLASATGHYRFSYVAARAVCAGRGMAVCTREQLVEAWQVGKLEVCACGWIRDKTMVFPMQHATHSCGNSVALHECGSTTYKGAHGDVFCCGTAPSERACTKCAPGKFVDVFGVNACKPCAAGRYSSSGGRTCNACPAGRASHAEGATSASACTLCAAGEFAGIAAAACASCPAGTGHNTPGSTTGDACAACTAGRFSNAKRLCVGCTAGRYQPEIGASSCVACTAGRAHALKSQANGTACAACAAGTYATEGSSKCMACPPGRASAAPLATMPLACTQCDKGSFSTGGASACQECGPGRFAPRIGASQCTACETGRFLATRGSSSKQDCSTCPVGHWCRHADSVPVACAAGRFRSAPGAQLASDCLPCAVGSFTGATRSSACIKCPIGTFQPRVGQSECVVCEAGTAQPREGRTAAEDCEKCAAGKYQPHAGLSFCIRCGLGLFQPAMGQTSCVQCAAGTAARSDAGASAESAAGACQDCIPGQYSDTPAAEACSDCPKGKASATAAARSALTCEHCSWGHFADAAGAAKCTACGQGKYGEPRSGAAKGSSAHCLHCPAGKFQKYDGSTECLFCAAGQFAAAPGSSKCRACARTDALRFEWSASGATTCYKKKLDCKVSSWSSWSACTRSCTLDGVRGTQQRTRAPVQQSPCALATGCEEAWGVGAKACADFAQHQEQVCNDTPCPQNCVPSTKLSAWETCTKSCGGGLARRTRAIRVPAAHGGTCDVISKCDLAECKAKGTCARCLAITTPCNTGSCDVKALPRCHGEHIRCAVKLIRANTLSKVSAPPNGGTCSKMWEYGYGDCHHCDTPAECALKGLHKTIVVTHDRKYAHLEGQKNMFRCFFEHDEASCFCTCRMHPPCMGRAAMLRNAPLVGNRWGGVPSRHACCNMCTNNPDCGAWQYKAASLQCTFFEGSPVYREFSASDAGGVWSGCKSGAIC